MISIYDLMQAILTLNQTPFSGDVRNRRRGHRARHRRLIRSPEMDCRRADARRLRNLG